MPVNKKNKNQNFKEKQVKDIVSKIKNSKTLIIVSLKSLPSKNFQEIKKSLRENAEIIVAKKNIIIRAIKLFNKPGILGLEQYIKENSAILISNIEGYELASLLFKKKNPVFAKAGQIAPDDIEIKEGITNLTPGPAISELGSLGIQISVENGKIAIKKAKIVVKKGEVINAAVCAILQKLDIKPFKIGLEPICIYDVSNDKIYSDINIDSEKATKEIAINSAKALLFAQKIGYICKETIKHFLMKANMEAKILESKINQSGGKT
ncbi:MAG: 50S ribosomal protein L10 [Candidatus Pacearchaeota archaeon]